MFSVLSVHQGLGWSRVLRLFPFITFLWVILRGGKSSGLPLCWIFFILQSRVLVLTSKVSCRHVPSICLSLGLKSRWSLLRFNVSKSESWDGISSQVRVCFSARRSFRLLVSRSVSCLYSLPSLNGYGSVQGSSLSWVVILLFLSTISEAQCSLSKSSWLSAVILVSTVRMVFSLTSDLVRFPFNFENRDLRSLNGLFFLCVARERAFLGGVSRVLVPLVS
jgi:hypothetical protein